MCKKIILLLLICCIAVTGFAQKNKRKTVAKAPKNTYFELSVNGCYFPEESTYCPNEPVIFTFSKDTNVVADYTFSWRIPSLGFFYTDTLELTYPSIPDIPFVYQVYLFLEIKSFKPPFDTTPVPVYDTLFTSIKLDYVKVVLDTTVCQGRAITVPINNPPGFLTYTGEETKIKEEILTTWETLQGACCDSLVCWRIKVNPYINREHYISSCDSVIWGDIVIKRSDDEKGDYTTDPPIERIFYVTDPPNYCCDCDTLIKLTVTIIDTPLLQILFNHDDFCKGDDMGGFLELKTNFTAFNWKYRDIDTTIFQEKKLDIEYPGIYEVLAYMDTSLYDTLKDLRIVNCFLWKDTLVEDCPLIIPNVITPNGDKWNEVLAIKKLNLERENELTIYDRWGKIVFQQKNYKCLYKAKDNKYYNEEDAFQGLTRDGRKLPEGTYYYAFKYKSIKKPKTYTGILMILR